MKKEKYDLIIIGAGPAGLTASIYASRYRINHLVLGQILGGAPLEAHKIENYPGFISISGSELMEKFLEQVKNLKAEIRQTEVVNIEKKDQEFEITDSENRKYQAKAIILALGTKRKKLNIPGEEKFLGKGVSYCAICDAPFFKNKIVAIIGGSNAAVSSALYLTDYAKEVYIIYRGDELKAEPILKERTEKNSKIKIIYQTNILEIKGKEKVEGVVLDRTYKNVKELSLDGVFIEIGSTPTISLVLKLGIEIDEDNYIKVDEHQATNIDGVYAAGDITNGSAKLRQIVTACAEGAVAATSVYLYLKNLKKLS
jgi:thioredoxin reductase (NADPH)